MNYLYRSHKVKSCPIQLSKREKPVRMKSKSKLLASNLARWGDPQELLHMSLSHALSEAV